MPQIMSGSKHEIVDLLTESDWEEISLTCLAYAKRRFEAQLKKSQSFLEPEDLVHQAIEKMLTGVRKMPDDLKDPVPSLTAYVIMIMKSHVSHISGKPARPC